jgi:hypothetical protein
MHCVVAAKYACVVDVLPFILLVLEGWTPFNLNTVYVFSEQIATFVLHKINSSVFITVVEDVFSAVRAESLYRAFHNILRDYKNL